MQGIADADFPLDLCVRQGGHNGATLDIGPAGRHIPGRHPYPELQTWGTGKNSASLGWLLLGQLMEESVCLGKTDVSVIHSLILGMVKRSYLVKLWGHHACCLGVLTPPNQRAKQTLKADTSE